MARAKKQTRFRYRLVDPKTRQFVVAGTKGAVRKRFTIAIPIKRKPKAKSAPKPIKKKSISKPVAPAPVKRPSKSVKKPSSKSAPLRDAKGRFVSSAKTKRTNATKKSASTRALKKSGIVLVKRWIGKARDGTQNKYEYERYELPIQAKELVGDIVEHVIRKEGKRRFLYGGQADFLDTDDNLFTNNTQMFLDTDTSGYLKVIKELAKLIISPSVPANFNRSEKVDVQGLYILIMFERISK